MFLKEFLSLISLKKKVEQLPKVSSSWKSDCLGYKQVASRFTTLIKTLDRSFSILSLEGYDKWGKTFFLKEWLKDLEEQNEIVGYYSAWDISAIEQPLTSFLSFLFYDLFESNKVKRSAIQQFKNINQELLSLNTLGKLISKSPLGVLSVFLDAAKETDKRDIGFILSELSLLQRRKENIRDFKKQLEVVVNKIRRGKNIYIMVDNLDMCRPRFIVDFLESIKYMLDVEGLVFIISISQDRSNVQGAISTILGPNFDLKSFIDLSLHLPKQPIKEFVRKLFQNVALPKRSKGPIMDSFIFYAESFELSLKMIQYCVKKIELSPLKGLRIDYDLFIFLLVLQSVNTDLYEELYLSYHNALEKIETILVVNRKKKWEKLKTSLEATFKEKELKSLKQIRETII